MTDGGGSVLFTASNVNAIPEAQPTRMRRGRGGRRARRRRPLRLDIRFGERWSIRARSRSPHASRP